MGNGFAGDVVEVGKAPEDCSEEAAEERMRCKAMVLVEWR